MNCEAILFWILVFVLVVIILFISIISRLGFFQRISRSSQARLDIDLPDGYVVKGLISKDFIKLKKTKIAGRIFYVCEGLVAGEEGEEETVFVVPVVVN